MCSKDGWFFLLRFLCFAKILFSIQLIYGDIFRPISHYDSNRHHLLCQKWYSHISEMSFHKQCLKIVINSTHKMCVCVRCDKFGGKIVPQKTSRTIVWITAIVCWIIDICCYLIASNDVTFFFLLRIGPNCDGKCADESRHIWIDISTYTWITACLATANICMSHTIFGTLQTCYSQIHGKC